MRLRRSRRPPTGRPAGPGPGRGWCAAAVAVACAAAFGPACSPSTRQQVLPALFDGAPRQGEPSRPPRRRVRRDLQQENEELRRALAEAKANLEFERQRHATAAAPAPAAERAKSWEEAAAALPRTSAGRVDWTRGVMTNVIAPRPGRDPRTPLQPVLELDVELSSFGEAFAVTFRHGSHTNWLSCANCHPALFPLGRKAPRAPATMKDMEQGRSCGACHGPVAFGPGQDCARCHRGSPARTDWRPKEAPRNRVEQARTWADARKLLPAADGGPDWSTALAQKVIAPRAGIAPGAKPEDTDDTEVVRVPGGDEEAKVVFPHAAHTALIKCDSCHGGLFEQEAGATKMSMELIENGQSCGACHGKVAFGADACGRCHPAMKEGK